jgi:predicted secreted protein
MTDLPDRVTLRRGEDQIVRLPSAAGAGYRWQASVDDDAIVSADVRFDQAVATAAGGAAFSPHELLVLAARTTGATRVHCVQRRGWERDVLPLTTYTLTVTVVASDDHDHIDKKGNHG